MSEPLGKQAQTLTHRGLLFTSSFALKKTKKLKDNLIRSKGPMLFSKLICAMGRRNLCTENSR